MIDVAPPPTPTPPGVARRSRRRIVVVVVSVLVVLLAGTITAVAWSFHYLHAAPLQTNGGGWLPPDAAHSRLVDAGPVTASVVPPRPGQPQRFVMTLTNHSGVSQTVLGLKDGKTLGDPRFTAEPITLQMSTRSTIHVDQMTASFTSRPVTIPPHDTYSLRLTIVTSKALWTGVCGKREWFDELELRVRVGIFTRTEHVHFDHLIVEIRSPC